MSYQAYTGCDLHNYIIKLKNLISWLNEDKHLGSLFFKTQF